MRIYGIGMAAVAALFTASAGMLVTAPRAMAQKPPSPADRAKLEQMRKAADDLDEGADPAAYRKAWEAVIAYGATLYPAGHPEIAWLEGELVTADYLQGDIKGALARADGIAERLDAAGAEYRDRRMELANAQVVILMTLSQHERARKLAAQVLEWRISQSGGKPSSNVSAAYSNYANAEFEFGNYDRAIELVRKAIAEAKRLDKIPANAAPRFANLPVYLFQTGRLEEAIEEAWGTQAILEGILPKGHPFLASNLNTLARILITLGRAAEAETVVRKAVDIAVARFGQSQQTVNYLTVLAQALTAQGKTEEAKSVAQSAADILTKDLGAEADRTLSARETLAGALAAAGERTQAMAILANVAAVRARKLPPFHRDRIGGGDRMAALSLKLGDLKAAQAAQAEAQQLRRATFPPEDIAMIAGEARLGAIEARGGDKAGGLKRALTAAALLDKRLRQIGVLGGRRSGRELEIRAGYAWALDAALSAGGERAAFMLAQRVLESSAGRAVQEAAVRSASGDPRLAVLIRERQDAAIELEALLDRQLRLAGRGADAAAIEAVAAQRGAAAVRLEQSSAAFKARAPQLAAPAGAEPLTVEAVQAALGADEALLIAAVGDASTGLFAVTRDGLTMAAAEGGQEIGALVARLRASLSPDAHAAGTRFDFDASSQLHAALLPQPLRAAIKGKPRLLVAANASLGALPFATLAPRQTRPGLRSARWLVRDHALVTLPSVASLGSARSAGGGGQKLRRFFAVGAPELMGVADLAGAFRSANMARQVRDLPALPATGPELRALAVAFAAPEQVILTGGGATERAIRSSDLARADVIAFATHGLTAGELDGLDEPALVVTPEGDDDGLLTASEIMRLRMAADWIILSACNTAAGGGSDESGLAGLGRAFLYAGGRNLLASHWSVRDDAAAHLSVETVRLYRRGADPAQALRQAMLGMLDRRPFAGAEQPINWAPFVFVGR